MVIMMFVLKCLGVPPNDLSLHLSKTSIVETSIPYLFIYFGSDDSHLLIPSATLSTLPSLSLFALDSLNIL